MSTQRIAPVRGQVHGANPRSRPSGWRRHLPAYLFLAPGFIVFSLTMLYPTVQAFVISLHEWSVVPGRDSEFVGAANYLRALSDPIVLRSFVNGAVYVVATVVPQLFLGLLLALVLDKPLRGRTAFRVLIYVPVISSWVVVSLLFRYLFATDGGLVNFVITDVTHLSDQGIDWFGGRWTAMAAIIALGLWKGVGWAMLIFLAALQSVPVSLHEAAQMDGANAVRRFFAVTIPSIRRTIMFVAILLVIGGFNVYISVKLMTDGGPSDWTQVPLTYLYRQAFNFLDFGYGSAIAFTLTVVVFIIAMVQLRLGRHEDEESAA